MNTEDRDNMPHLVLVVSNDDSYDDFIGAPQVSQGEPLVYDGPPASPIPPKPITQQSSEEALEVATPGRPIWERDKKST